MIGRLRGALAARHARWESLCLRCGRCCYEKEQRGASVVTNYRKPCIHLDVATSRCRVYDQRFEVCSRCRRMTILHALFVPWLPDTCGYVQRYRYRRKARSFAEAFGAARPLSSAPRRERGV